MSLFLILLKKRKYFVILTMCILTVLAIVSILWNFHISRIIQTISFGSKLSVKSIGTAIFLLILTACLQYIKTYFSGYTCESLTHDLRMGYAGYFISLPMQEIEQLNTGEEISKLQNEIEEVSRYLNNSFFPLLYDSIQFLTAFGWLFFINKKLLITAEFPVLIILFYVVFSSRIISKAAKKSQAAKSDMNYHIDVLIHIFPVIYLYDAAGMVYKNYCSKVSEWTKHTVRSERTRARLLSLSSILSGIPLMLLFLIGGRMVIKDTMTIGTLYLFFNLFGSISGVMMNMPGFIAAFRQFLVSMERLSTKIQFDEKEQKEWI